MHNEEPIYIGFWPRLGASLIDSLLILFVTGPLLFMIYGESYWASDEMIQGPADILLSWIFPAVAVVLFWIKTQSTPGKKFVSAIIVDARTGNKPTTSQYIWRYLGYFVAAIPFFVGFIWVAFDKRKQGWHDKLAGTVVIKHEKPEVNESSFES